MSDDKFTKLTDNLNTELAKLRREIPDVMAGFTALGQASRMHRLSCANVGQVKNIT